MINSIVTESENIGEEMNDSYEVIRQAIDSNKVDSLDTATLTSVHDVFMQGTAKYDVLVEEIAKLKAPVKVLGIHKKFQKSFDTYVVACKDMVEAVTESGVDVNGFNTSEANQDAATDEIAFSIQRITQLIMK
ncbi:hypothetical protein CBF37_02150 [Vagococcus vulneris]|uniref:LXG domain-containing protein n=2 Tax=Vagococcus vulneris TaxID=1977869 RepID=A0A430A1Q8_9ENTE|nr:hypothetical protein CBF37_02150 [Vagococcus vulneris]